MGWFTVDRRPRPGGDPQLAIKAGLFVAAAAAAMLGFATESDWPITVAIVLLAAGLALRFLPRRQPPAE